MRNIGKRLVVMRGSLLSLKVGEAAVIYCGGKITRTGAVVSIQSDARDDTRFETLHARYLVVPVPDCAPAMRRPALLACA